VPIKRSIIIESLKRHEGYRQFCYQDSVGVWTIGHGRNLEDVGLSRDEAAMLLEGDVTRAIMQCLQTWPWVAQLDEVRAAVIVEMAVNLGVHGLGGFRKMLAACEKGDFATAASEMLASTWRVQVGARAYRLAQQMATGKVPAV
jgi:lysozyme